MKRNAFPEPRVFDERVCQLGESPIWHPTRQELFWVDIPTQSLFSQNVQGDSRSWVFDEMLSAVGWVDQDYLLLAFEDGLYSFNIDNSQKSLLCHIEESNSNNRSNDGRADPWGGFWISTMSKQAEKGAGSIYRWWRGELKPLLTKISIPNGICFDQDRNLAYFADSAEKKLWRIELDPKTGWPESEPSLFLNWEGRTCDPDGAIVDREGNIWIALWDASCVEVYAAEGNLLQTIEIDSPRPTCPAFGGENYKDLYLTTAAIGLPDQNKKLSIHGKTLVFSSVANGKPEPAIQVSFSD